jgi:ElaB/YqjD/DUF883 family membrane-anchored ribosome-binding protein
MTADPSRPAGEDTVRAGTAADHAAAAIRAGLAAVELGLAEAARIAGRLAEAGREALQTGSDPAAGRVLDDAQRFIVERVKARPVTALMAGLGAGILVGLLLSSRGK